MMAWPAANPPAVMPRHLFVIKEEAVEEGDDFCSSEVTMKPIKMEEEMMEADAPEFGFPSFIDPSFSDLIQSDRPTNSNNQLPQNIQNNWLPPSSSPTTSSSSPIYLDFQQQIQQIYADFLPTTNFKFEHQKPLPTMAAQFPLLTSSFHGGAGAGILPQFAANSHLLLGQQPAAQMPQEIAGQLHPQQQLQQLQQQQQQFQLEQSQHLQSQLQPSFLINSLQNSSNSLATSSANGPSQSSSCASSATNAPLATSLSIPNMNSATNLGGSNSNCSSASSMASASSYHSAGQQQQFNAFTRPHSARPVSQLRRASSASIEAAVGKFGHSSSQGGLGDGGMHGGGSSSGRPASLQHHELLLFSSNNNGGGDQQQQQRTTPVPRKFEPTFAGGEMAALMEEKPLLGREAELKAVERLEAAKKENGQSIQPTLLDHPQIHRQPLGSANATQLVPQLALRRHSSLAASSANFSSAKISTPQSAGISLNSAPYSTAMFGGQQGNGMTTNSTASSATANPLGGGADSNVTLWQFLLELLAANDHPDLIQWTNNEGEFKLHDSEAVARLWGTRKGKPNMNYDKLSRALRYYYDKNIIKKVIGQKFVYRFVMDGKNGGGGNGGAGMGSEAPGNPELVLYAMSKAGLNVNGGGQGQRHQGNENAGGNRFEHPLSLQPPPSSNSHHRAIPSCSSSMTESAKSMGGGLNPNSANGHHHRRANNGTTLTPSPANSSCSPTGSVESSSGVSSGSGMSSSFVVPNNNVGGLTTLNGIGSQFCGLGQMGGLQIKQEPGLHHSMASTSTMAQIGGEKSAAMRQTRKRKSPSEATLAGPSSAGGIGHCQSMLGGNGTGPGMLGGQHRQSLPDDSPAAKIGCGNGPLNQPPSLRRARPQPLDLTSVNNPPAPTPVSNLAGQMSQMVASSPLLFALQQHHQQQSPLLSALSAISNSNPYAASPLAALASPLAAQAAAFQLASNIVATLSPNLNATAANGGNASLNAGNNNSNANQNTLGNLGGYQLPNNSANSNGLGTLAANGTTTATTTAPLSAAHLYSQLHSALTTPNATTANLGGGLGGMGGGGQQLRTPLQSQVPNSAVISAFINQLTNGPNTPFAQQQQQQIHQQQPPSLFQFPPTSNIAIAHTLAMLSSPGLPLAGQSPFPFMSQLAALQTPNKFSSALQGAGNQRSPDSLKTPMGGLSFEFGQVMAAAAANKK